MNRFVLVALLVMAWGYWELSGGAGFVPEQGLAGAEATVTRADTSELESLPAAAPEAVIAIPPENIATLTGPAPDAAADAVDAAVQEAAAVPAAEPAAPEPAAPAAEGGADLRVVTGDRVNLREGPGTDFGAIDQLASGTIAEVIETGADGWVRVQVQGTSLSGWMSSDFLLPVNG